MFFLFNYFLVLLFSVCLIFLARLFLAKTALIYVVRRWIDWVDDGVHVHQHFRVPEINENNQENQFYRKVALYVNSLTSVEESDFTNLLSGKKPNDIVLHLDDEQVVHDAFLGAKLSWTNKVERSESRDRICTSKSFVLRIKKKDKRRILKPYLQHIVSISSNLEQQRRPEIRLFVNNRGDGSNHRWSSLSFTHPATFDTLAMDLDLKNKIKSDLEAFLKSKQYYHKLGRVWKRSYLLYGLSGTGKSSFVSAMAKFLCYDIYNVDLSRVSDDSDLKMLLAQTSTSSLIVIEDLDRVIKEKSATQISLSGLLNFMDGVVNADERIMVFTMNSKDNIDAAMLRPGRIDVHIHFPLCDFNGFKSLANSYLGVKEHKLFPQVEEIFQSGAKMSPAEIGELMLVNRSSPSRALKSVITALQFNGGVRRLSEGASSYPSPALTEESGGVPWKDTVVPKEFRKLYGLLRMKSSKRSDSFDHDPGMIQR